MILSWLFQMNKFSVLCQMSAPCDTLFSIHTYILAQIKFDNLLLKIDYAKLWNLKTWNWYIELTLMYTIHNTYILTQIKFGILLLKIDYAKLWNDCQLKWCQVSPWHGSNAEDKDSRSFFFRSISALCTLSVLSKLAIILRSGYRQQNIRPQE